MSVGEAPTARFWVHFTRIRLFFGGLFPSAHSAAPEIGLTPVTRCPRRCPPKTRTCTAGMRAAVALVYPFADAVPVWAAAVVSLILVGVSNLHTAKCEN